MYEDIMDDPEVQAFIDEHDGKNTNDLPLDESGKPIEQTGADNKEDDAKDDENGGENGKDDPNKKEDTEDEAGKDDAELDDSSLDDFLEEVPEIDYTPETEFGKSIKLDTIDDGFAKYALAHLEPLTLTDKEGKSIKAFTVDDIPKGFEFENQLEATKATTAFARLEARGDQLKKEYEDLVKQREDVIASNEAATAQYDGLTEAIKDGEFPKLELNDNGELDEDSKINILADDIIGFQREINKDRTPARSISFDTALHRFKRENPDRFKELDGKENEALSKEDKQRHEYARRTSHASGRPGSESNGIDYGALSREEFDEYLNDPNFDIRNMMK